MASRVPGANPNVAFIGGAESRNLAPPSIIGQGLPSANTNVSAPQGGVNPSQIKNARPNAGSNIGLPYSRLVPIQNGNALLAAPLSKATNPSRETDPSGKKRLVTETEDLRSTTLAFVLGLRSSTTTSTQPATMGGFLEDGEVPVYNGHCVGTQPAIMPGMVGTERFQQLCSIEYLHAYYHSVLSGKTIALNGLDPAPTSIEAISRTLDVGDRTTGPLGEVKAHIVGINPDGSTARIALDGSFLTDTKDLARLMARPDAAVNTPVGAPQHYQGIFTRDKGPFLVGKGAATKLIHGTANNLPAVDGTTVRQPYDISRNLGDDLAFSVLDSLMARQGLTDWRPDGIVLSKGANDPSDKLSDEYLDARDGQLYNLRVQGPAIGTTWTGDRSMETLPLDKVFVCLVADVWFDVLAVDPEVKSLVANGGFKTAEDRTKYLKLVEAALGEGIADDVAFEDAQKDTWRNGQAERPVLANFRIVASTSSQMINYSQYKSKSNSNGASKRLKLEGTSRMGLRLSDKVGEYVVGGWQIGNVLDTSASRAAMPQGSNIGVRTAPNSSALNINVNIGWWSADRLSRAFNNPEGSVTARHVPKKLDVNTDPTGDQHVDGRLGAAP